MAEAIAVDNRTQFTGEVQLSRYVVPNQNREGWGYFVIGSDGFFSVVSDYGSYAYWWSHAGTEFRKFLCGLDADYLAQKLSSGARVYSEKKTWEAIRGHILERRRDGGWTKERAEEEWTRLREFKPHSFDLDLMREWCRDTTIDNPSEFYRDERPAQVTAFCERLFPRFVELLKAELAKEKEVARG